ncbi:MAG: 30S ribosomal protein S21 [Candidatus Omnitrophica bacterium]|nr:30S ribosomal protein S21 [Candidatus Omnitrophota bacterium]MBU4479234.1 30S ribosomal protein S21 [Candidatus Omnitrophota bacterium]MCG2703924.1 30S ribosomal protein S21 [Candidatus Omnitrophota bacterium]
MAKVMICKGDIEKALRSFKWHCKKEGILRECKERRHYTKPSAKKRLSAVKKRRVGR